MTNARFCLGDPAVLEILSEKSCRVVACTHIIVGKDVTRHFGLTYKKLECTQSSLPMPSCLRIVLQYSKTLSCIMITKVTH